jgi:hypothetical protein
MVSEKHHRRRKGPGANMKPSVSSAIAAFGAKAKAKLANPGASGEPEDQLRAPFEQLLADLAELANFPKTAVRSKRLQLGGRELSEKTV